MSFNVRCFGYRGITQLIQPMPKQFSSDSVFQLIQPYEWAQNISVSSVAASTSPTAVPDKTQIVRIEVPDGSVVRYEINPSNRPGGAIIANTNSPILSGINQFFFQQGWTVSLIDAAGLP